MYNLIMQNPTLAVIGLALITAFFIFLLIKLMQTVGLEKIRATVYQAFVQAENNFNYGENDEKFEYVLNIAKTAIPAPFNIFITENLLRKIVQMWFALVKDLLDDGKMNGTGKTESEE